MGGSDRWKEEIGEKKRLVGGGAGRGQEHIDGRSSQKGANSRKEEGIDGREGAGSGRGTTGTKQQS